MSQCVVLPAKEDLVNFRSIPFAAGPLFGTSLAVRKLADVAMPSQVLLSFRSNDLRVAAVAHRMYRTNCPRSFDFSGWRALLLAIFACAALAAVAPAPALAHAVLVDSSPHSETVLSEAPEHMMLFFDQPVRLVSVRMLAAGGETVSVSTGTDQPATAIRILIGEVLGRGVYTFAYRGVSTDGHPVQGTFRFAIGIKQTFATAPLPSENCNGWLAVAIGARFANTVILAIVAGGLVYGTFVAPLPAATRNVFAWLSCVGAIASLFDVGIRTGFAFDAPPMALFDLHLWRAGLEQTSGLARLLAAFGFLFLAFAFRNDVRAIGALGIVLAVAGLVGSSHTTTPEPRGLGILAIAVHVVAALYWLGSFAPLLDALARRPGDARRELERFARSAPAMIAALALSGATLFAIQSAGKFPPLSGIYILAALLKLLLVAAMLFLAVDNRRLASRMWAHAPNRAASRFARNIRLESIIALGVIGFATVLAFLPPPRMAAAIADRSASTAPTADVESATFAVAGASAGAVVTVAPGRTGSNSIEIFLTDIDELPLEAPAAILRITRGDAEEQRYELRRTGPGAYRLAHLELPASGLWRFNIRAETANGSIELETEVTVK